MMLSERMRLTQLVLSNCQMDRRALETLATMAPSLSSLVLVRCTFSETHPRLLTAAFSPLKNLQTLCLFECDNIPLEVSRALFSVVTRLACFAFCARWANSRILHDLQSCSLQYLMIEGHDQFSPDLVDMARILAANRTTLVGLSLDGILRGPLRIERFWEDWSRLQFPHLSFLSLGSTTLDEPKALALPLVAPALALLEASMDAILAYSLSARLSLLLALRIDQKWYPLPGIKDVPEVAALIENAERLWSIWLRYPFVCPQTGRLLTFWLPPHRQHGHRFSNKHVRTE